MGHPWQLGIRDEGCREGYRIKEKRWRKGYREGCRERSGMLEGMRDKGYRKG